MSLTIHKNSIFKSGEPNLNEEMADELNKVTQGFFIPIKDVITPVERVLNKNNVTQYPTLIFAFESPLSEIWSKINIGNVMFSIFASPIDIAFQFEGVGSVIFDVLNYFSLILFSFDILLTFRTTYLNSQNEQVISGKLIGQRYVKSSQFWIDLITTLPIPEIIDAVVDNSNSSKYLVWLKQLKLIRIVRILRVQKLQVKKPPSHLAKLVVLILKMILTVHWLTCIWFSIVQMEYENNYNVTDYEIWLPSNLRNISPQIQDNYFVEYFYQNSSSIQIYCFTFYTLVNTLIGNDMAPVTILQATLNIIIVVVSPFLLADLFKEISQIIASINQKELQLQEQIYKMNMKLEKVSIPIQKLKQQVQEFQRFCFYNREKREYRDMTEILSHELQRDFHSNVHFKFFRTIPFLSNFQPSQLKIVLELLESHIFVPDETIIQKRQIVKSCFIIMQGVVVQLKILKGFQNLKDQNVILLGRGSVFKEKSLVYEQVSSSYYISKDFSICQVLHRNKFLKAIQEMPNFKIQLLKGLGYEHTIKGQQYADVLRQKVFKNWPVHQLVEMILSYMNHLYLEKSKMLLVPKSQPNALYFILEGEVLEIFDSIENRKKLTKFNDIEKTMQFRANSIESFNFQTENYINSISDFQKHGKYPLLREGECIGRLSPTLILEENDKQSLNNAIRPCGQFFMVYTNTQFGIFTQKQIKLMKQKDPVLFNMFFKDIEKYYQIQNNYTSLNDETNPDKLPQNNFVPSGLKELNSLLIESIDVFHQSSI